MLSPPRVLTNSYPVCFGYPLLSFVVKTPVPAKGTQEVEPAVEKTPLNEIESSPGPLVGVFYLLKKVVLFLSLSPFLSFCTLPICFVLLC